MDDIGNLAFPGKLRNIRKSDESPWEYFKSVPDDELLRDYLIGRALLADDSFEAFVHTRRERTLKAALRFDLAVAESGKVDDGVRRVRARLVGERVGPRG